MAGVDDVVSWICCWRSVAILLLIAGSRAGTQVIETGLVFVEEPRDVIVARGRSLMWNCLAVSSEGNTLPNVTWFKDGRVITDTRRTILANGTLNIRRIRGPMQPSDEDIYECMVWNNVGAILSKPALLQIAYLNSSSEPRRHLTAHAGELVRMPCSVRGLPLPQIIWTHNDVRLQLNNSRIVRLASGVLEIYPVHTTDSGRYRCYGNNTLGNVSGIEFNLTVISGSSVTSEIEVLARPANQTVLSGDTVQFECAFTTSQNIEILWTHQSMSDNSPVPVSDPRSRVIGRSNLQLSNVVTTDSGVYRCSVTGVPLSLVAVLEVHVLPYLISVTPNTVVRFGSPLRIECLFGGTPTPEIHWVKDGFGMRPDERTVITGGTVDVAVTAFEDSGLYQCWAESDAGTEYAVIRVIVEMPSLLTTTNAYGDHDEAPDPPTGLEARSIDSRTVILSWDLPLPNNTKVIVAYAVHYYTSRTGDLQKVVTENVITLDQLTPFTNYTFWVVAYGLKKASPPSQLYNMMTGEDVPVDVPHVRCLVVNITALEVEWDLLTDDKARGYITRYELLYRMSRSQGQISLDSPATVTVIGQQKYIIAGLQHGGSYDILVLACTAVGCTSLVEREWTWMTCVVNYFPDYLRADAMSESSIMVKWFSKPEAVPYTLKYWPSGSTATRSLTTERESLLVTGLQPFTEYQFAVYSASGDRVPIYNVARCRTAQTYPSEPLDVEGYATDALSRIVLAIDISLSWSAPKQPNGIIQSYMIQLSSDADLPESQWTNIARNGSLTYTVISDLDSRPAVYYVKLRAVNGRGIGPASAVVNISTVVLRSIPEWQIGIIVGTAVGICCIIICVTVLLILNRCRNRTTHVRASEPRSVSYLCDGFASTNSSRAAFVGGRGGQKQQDNEMDCFIDTKGVSSTPVLRHGLSVAPVRDAGEVHQMTAANDKSKRYATSVLDETTMPLCANTSLASSNPSSPCRQMTDPSDAVTCATGITVTDADDPLQDINDNCQPAEPSSPLATRPTPCRDGSCGVESVASSAPSVTNTVHLVSGESTSCETVSDDGTLQCADSGIRLNGDSDDGDTSPQLSQGIDDVSILH